MDLLAGAALLKLPRCTLEPLLERFIQFQFGIVVEGAGETAVTSCNGQGETLLIQAAKQGDEASVVMLLMYACLVQQTSSSSSSSINNFPHTWINNSKSVLMDLLCARDKQGMEALHYAADLGHTGILQCLIQLGGATIIDSCAGHGARTALHMAAAAGHADCVRCLLQAATGSSSSVPSFNKTKMICINDLFGQTALHLAAESGHTAVLSLLLDQQQELQDDNDHDNIHTVISPPILECHVVSFMYEEAIPIGLRCTAQYFPVTWTASNDFCGNQMPTLIASVTKVKRRFTWLPDDHNK
jgi:ankyrin repeat protein